MDRRWSKNNRQSIRYSLGYIWYYYFKYNYYWNNFLDIIAKLLNPIVWFYSISSIILWLWVLYLFTIREWLDWNRIKKNKPIYDSNGIPRIIKMRNIINKNYNENERTKTNS